jgi:hypothetical protein
MKVRVAIVALLVASLLGFGFSRSVSAASTCPWIDNETDKEVHQCASNYVVDAALPMGDYLWVLPVKGDANLPNLPRSQDAGPAITLSVVDWQHNPVSAVHMEVCLADSIASGNVFMWSGGWVALSTYHLPGWDCAATSLTGTYSHN